MRDAARHARDDQEAIRNIIDVIADDPMLEAMQTIRTTWAEALDREIERSAHITANLMRVWLLPVTAMRRQRPTMVEMLREMQPPAPAHANGNGTYQSQPQHLSPQARAAQTRRNNKRKQQQARAA